MPIPVKSNLSVICRKPLAANCSALSCATRKSPRPKKRRRITFQLESKETMMQIDNKIFLVSGGASGLGAATGEMLVKAGAPVDDMIKRSKEHTSELQSLMRISYAVFCLTKKRNSNTTNPTHI